MLSQSEDSLGYTSEHDSQAMYHLQSMYMDAIELRLYGRLMRTV